MTDQQDVFTEAATEILNRGSKAFRALRDALEMADRRLEVAAHAEGLRDGAVREKDAALTEQAQAEKDASDTRARAKADAERVLDGARREAERARGEVAVLVAERDTLKGEVNELTAKRTALAEDVARLTGAVKALTQTP